ncbi:thioesterase family protein [Streptomyces sp. NPDC048290]|uniref:acyl-CoA thioesterase n=1 Tax=Streptomyces sp. NPDC048290 TaxID=3155811 RepID=UPI003447FF8A
MTLTTDIQTHVDPEWWAWEGAHGGHLAALALTAVRDRFAGAARPVRTLTTHFLAPVDVGPLHFAGSAPAAGRRTASCLFTGHQNGAPVLLGTALFAPDRPGPSYEGRPAPRVPDADRCPVLALPGDLALFARQLEIRPATEDRPLAGGERAELTAWVRFTDGRALDAAAVATLTDVLPPALYAHWHTPRPVPTAELTIHFTDALTAAAPEGPALVRIRTERADGAWAVEDSAVWSADGRLLALGRQARLIRAAQPAAGTVNS